MSTVSDAGLRITVLPAASAAATPPQGIASGKFHGETTTTTPRPRGVDAGQSWKCRWPHRRRSGRSRSLRRLPGRPRRASCRLRRASRPAGRRERRRARRRHDAESGIARRSSGDASRRDRRERTRPRGRCRLRSLGGSGRPSVPGREGSSESRVGRPSVISSPPMTSGTSAAWVSHRGCHVSMIDVGPAAVLREGPIGVGCVAE